MTGFALRKLRPDASLQRQAEWIVVTDSRARDAAAMTLAPDAGQPVVRFRWLTAGPMVCTAAANAKMRMRWVGSEQGHQLSELRCVGALGPQDAPGAGDRRVGGLGLWSDCHGGLRDSPLRGRWYGLLLADDGWRFDGRRSE